MSFLYTIGVLIPVVIGIAVFGFYPVALVDFSPILFINWKKAYTGAENFMNTEARLKVGGKLINFEASENMSLRLDVRRGALTFLIEDRMIKQEGEKFIKGFDMESVNRVEEVLSSSNNIADTAKTVYGFSGSDFNSLVLLPQARRDLLKETFLKQNYDFDKWLAGLKKNKKVRIWFVPFGWDGEQVR